MKHREPNPATYLAAILATELAPGGGAPIGNPSYRAARDAESLIRLGRKAQKIAEDQYNRPWTDSDYARAEKTRASIERQASDILAAYGATEINAYNDPRGFGLIWRFASGRSNSFAGNVWGV